MTFGSCTSEANSTALWIENTEGGKFWMKVFNDLKTRSVHHILLVVTDGLKGMPKALAGRDGLARLAVGHALDDAGSANLRTIHTPAWEIARQTMSRLGDFR